MGLQPLDYAMGSTKVINIDDDRYATISYEELKTIKSSKNLPLVQSIFARTQDYSFMHINPVESIIKAIRSQLP